MSTQEDRRAELIAAAVADQLDAVERAELLSLAAVDPTIDMEIDDMRRLVDRLSTAGGTPLPWKETQPSATLRHHVIATATRDSIHRSRRPAFLMSAAAVVVGIAIGAGVVLGVDAAANRPVTGPPGTLGAFETIQFSGTPAGIEIEGGLVAHTWGTETVLELNGVPSTGEYEVFVVEQSGTARASGTFFGSSVTIDCRMNAAVLREDVGGIEIRKIDGSVLATADVPDGV